MIITQLKKPPLAVRALLQAHTAVEILRSPGWQLLLPGDTTASGWTLPVREGHIVKKFVRHRDEEKHPVAQRSIVHWYPGYAAAGESVLVALGVFNHTCDPSLVSTRTENIASKAKHTLVLASDVQQWRRGEGSW